MIDPHDMMCQELVEVLTEYLDATLGAHDRARLEAHLTVCDDCREYVAQFQRTVDGHRPRRQRGARADAARGAPARVPRQRVTVAVAVDDERPIS